MITKARLYAIPILFSPLLIIPIIGWLLYAIIFSAWLFRSAGDIILNVHDIKYRPGEYSKKDKNLKIHDSPEEPQYNQAEELT